MLACKSEHNSDRKNNVLLLMINGDAEKYYYFSVKCKLELSSFEWLRNKKEAVFSGDK